MRKQTIRQRRKAEAMTQNPPETPSPEDAPVPETPEPSDTPTPGQSSGLEDTSTDTDPRVTGRDDK